NFANQVLWFVTVVWDLESLILAWALHLEFDFEVVPMKLHILLLTLFYNASLFANTDAPNDVTSDVQQCAASTRFFAARKADFESDPASRLGQVLAASADYAPIAAAVAGGAVGSYAGHQIPLAANAATARLGKDVTALGYYNAYEKGLATAQLKVEEAR